jgi:uncharacterized membrane protein
VTADALAEARRQIMGSGMNDESRSERRIKVTVDQFAVGTCAAYALSLAAGAIIVLLVFASVGIFYNQLADPAAHVSMQDIVIGTAIICVLLMMVVVVLIWGAKAILRRKPWQAGMFIILLCGCLFLFFRSGPRAGFTLTSALALGSVAVLVIRWKPIFVEKRE